MSAMDGTLPLSDYLTDMEERWIHRIIEALKIEQAKRFAAADESTNPKMREYISALGTGIGVAIQLIRGMEATNDK